MKAYNNPNDEGDWQFTVGKSADGKVGYWETAWINTNEYTSGSFADGSSGAPGTENLHSISTFISLENAEAKFVGNYAKLCGTDYNVIEVNYDSYIYFPNLTFTLQNGKVFQFITIRDLCFSFSTTKIKKILGTHASNKVERNILAGEIFNTAWNNALDLLILELNANTMRRSDDISVIDYILKKMEYDLFATCGANMCYQLSKGANCQNIKASKPQFCFRIK